MSIASQYLFDPIKNVLEADAPSLLQEFEQGVVAAASQLVNKLPQTAAGQTEAVAIQTVLGLGSLIANTAISNVLASHPAIVAAANSSAPLPPAPVEPAA